MSSQRTDQGGGGVAGACGCDGRDSIGREPFPTDGIMEDTRKPWGRDMNTLSTHLR